MKGFTERYNVNQRVYSEATSNTSAAIEPEKQLKGWRREKKLELIRGFNPTWRDFSADLFVPPDVKGELRLMLEGTIVIEPCLLSEEWMPIGRQTPTGYGGRIDRLAIGPDGGKLLLEALLHDPTL